MRVQVRRRATDGRTRSRWWPGFLFAISAVTTALTATALTVTTLTVTALPAAAQVPPEADPSAWPQLAAPFVPDPPFEQALGAMLAAMTPEEKVGQIIQADISTIQPNDLLQYPLGAILNGGDSKPGGNARATPAAWLELADRFHEAARSRGGTFVPLLWGTDAVHGNSNVLGATIFPHNAGLGATRDLDLIREIGRVTALETTVTGQNWAFAPTLAVARDDHWGRTYESYSEDPQIVASAGAALISGLQGRVNSQEFLRPGRVLATAKHFLGDGGTSGGKDQGDTRVREGELRDTHGLPYMAALDAGVQTVMASYSSWNGRKMHARADLLTRVLKGRWAFYGFVVGDWNGHGQIPGCSEDNCPAAFLAGVDMFMAPVKWRELFAATLAQVRSGLIPQARLDEAVYRILRVKGRLGLFLQPQPSLRAPAGDFALLGAPEHRALARRAVAQSIVLLKNEGAILPLAPRLNVLVAGDGADNIAMQCGGWTLSWQGGGHGNADFPNGQSIHGGILDAVRTGGGTAMLGVDGRYTRRPDVAIVVFGEDPYAEGRGDLPTTAFSATHARNMELLNRLKRDRIPVVSIFLSGRPLWTTPEMQASDAFVAAFLPGSEGGGLADVLFRKPDGSINADFRGRLSFSWPRIADQVVNVGDPSYSPLFPLGYGLGYAAPSAR